MNGADMFRRPEDEYRLPIDIIARNESPGAAVVGEVAMVAQDEIFVGRNHASLVAAVVSILSGNVALNQLFAVDNHVAVVDLYSIPRQANHAFDVRLAVIVLRGPENHRIAAPDVTELELVAELVYKKTLLVEQARHHAGALYLHGTVQEQDHEHCDQDRKHHVPQPGKCGDQVRTGVDSGLEWGLTRRSG